MSLIANKSVMLPAPKHPSGELHYPGRQDPKVGQLMGPGINGHYRQVTGAVYDADTDRTTVYVDVVLPETTGEQR